MDSFFVSPLKTKNSAVTGRKKSSFSPELILLFQKDKYKIVGMETVPGKMLSVPVGGWNIPDPDNFWEIPSDG